MKKLAVSLAWLLIVGVLPFFSGVGLALSDGSAYGPDKAVRERIKALTVEQAGDRTAFGAAWLERQNGNRVLFLTGSPYEMGYQHGVLLKDEIRRGVVPVFADPLASVPDLRALPGFVKKLLSCYLDYEVYTPIERTQPREYLAEIKGIADGCGLDYKVVFRANFLSDFNMNMLPMAVGKLDKLPAPPGECSSFVVSGPATADHALIFGRNTDYGGQGHYAANQVITLYQPAGGLRYVKVCTAGLLKCNSAMNEKGLVIGGHFMGYAGADPAGQSFTILENEIMRKAGTLAEAVALVRTARRGGAFGLVVADGKTGEAVAMEATRDLIGVRPMENHAVYLTNYARTDELRTVDLVARHNLGMRGVAGRFVRLGQLLQANYGAITPARAAQIMGDHVDPVVNRERGVGFTVGSLSTVESAVFAPADGRFWVATGGEPVWNNAYRGYSFADLFAGGHGPYPETLPGYQWQDASHQAALMEYMRAFIAHKEDPQAPDRVMPMVAKAGSLDPGEPIYMRLYASFLIQQGDYATARSILEKSLTLPQAVNEKAVAYLLIAQTLDGEGKRAEAAAMCRKIVELRDAQGRDYFQGISDMLFARARKGLKKPLKVTHVEQFTAFSLETGIE